ncbi:Glycosyl hydrolases family 2 [Nocardioides scoriae]|uniref:Glycosyl hydrolases family 2 n=1 Tax=Nocardioides scoriae TaxID=642780 RepID=A0A1H1STL4_9ACTN|nr:sugar-binding domain-containing protein [Nocardioides scoriae]SDS51360.1 Glycosyl hydrolases family 2 [Nocardioides scoriae]
MTTRWGRELDPDAPLPEHPRPQLERPSWSSLNGRWEHAFTASGERPAAYDGPITVPFSPEAPLSGVERQLQPDEWLWYRRTFPTPPVVDGGRVLLHLGAVDQSCTVWVDGHEVGGHTGGYLPFTLDVTDALAARRHDATAEHVLEVRVRDLSDTSWHARGKQKLRRGNIWYTAQSGIWQTVWLEWVPPRHVERLVLVPHLDAGALEVTVHAQGGHRGATATVVVRSGEQEVGRAEVAPGVATRVALAQVRPWSPEDPHLYDLEVTFGEDRVTSYAGLRSVAVGTDARGHRRLLLNGAPYPHVGVLDQGYWPDGLLTPPGDAAMVHDITSMKDLGFTVLRKHAKLEPARWYAHCDRIGVLVWQDVVNGGTTYRGITTRRPASRLPPVPDRLFPVYGRGHRAGRAEFLSEVEATVATLGNAPSVVVWTPFNEGWGQFSSRAVARLVRRLDPTRLVMATSGWVDHGGGDLRSFHRYGKPFRMPAHRGGRRAVVLSEYGGYSHRVEDHQWGPRMFGYRKFKVRKRLQRAFVQLHDALVTEAARGLSATVYTQLSDVEDELNGLWTYDREVLKLDAEVVREVTARLRAAMTAG